MTDKAVKKATRTSKKVRASTIKAGSVDVNASITEELAETRAELDALREDNSRLTAQLSAFEQRLDEALNPSTGKHGSPVWDERLAGALRRLGQGWSDYGPLIVIALFLLMIVGWLTSWNGLFRVTFTLLMLWLFTVSLGWARSRIRTSYASAVLRLRS